MSSEQLTTPANSRHTDIDFDDEASDLLSRWPPLAGALPQLIGARAHEVAVRDLIAWDERVFQLDGYCADPPNQGLDALVDELAHVSVPPHDHAEFTNGRWAIRVAEELVSWQRPRRDDGPGSPPTGRATDRPELAIGGAPCPIAGWEVGSGSMSSAPSRHA